MNQESLRQGRDLYVLAEIKDTEGIAVSIGHLNPSRIPMFFVHIICLSCP